jgi:hypothetical protein
VNTVDLARRLARGGGRHDRSVVLLAALATAVATVVIVLTLGALTGTGARADREAWTQPRRAAEGAATAMMATTTQATGHDHVRTTVFLAELPGHEGQSPVPPGLDHFPRPGEELVPGRAGRISPDQDLVVRGVSASDPVFDSGFIEQSQQLRMFPPTPVADFRHGAGGGDSAASAASYRSLTLIASVLLVVPVLSLTGAVARLAAGRRAQRVAGLRLAGAPRRTLLALVGIEAAVPALAGSVAGVLVSVPLAAACSRMPLQGMRWFAGDLLPGVPTLAAVVVVLTGLAVGSAALAARRAVADPLSVREGHRAAAPTWLRLVAVVAALGVFVWLTRSGAQESTVLVAFMLCTGVLSLIGPVVVRLAGQVLVRRFARGASSAPALIAGRRVTDDPHAGWRLVSGIAFAAFIAAFFATFGGAGQTALADPRVLEVPVSAAQAADPGTVAAADRALAEAGVPATVSLGATSGLASVTGRDVDGEPTGSDAALMLRLPDDTGAGDRARAALAAVFPGNPVATAGDIARVDTFGTDMRRATLVILGVSFLVAATAVGVTSAARVMDSRELHTSLRRAGTPLSVLERTRRTEVLLPLVAAVVPMAAAGLVLGAPLAMSGGGISASGLVVTVLTALVGLGGVMVAVRASSPLLERTSRP